MVKRFLFFSLLLLSPLFSAQITKDIAIQAEYIVCIDGGGSKTSLQILDRSGHLLNLKKGNVSGLTLLGPSSNINAVGEEGFHSMLSELFDKLSVNGIPFSHIQTETLIVGGFAGLSSIVNEALAKECFMKKGFALSQLVLMPDMKMAAELIDNQGIVLIAGTGSIAFGIDGDQEYRAGGFGRLIGDEGSGYYMGICALKSALEEEYGYGMPTEISKKIRERFHVAQVKDLIAQVHAGILTPAQIAEIAADVIYFAKNNDQVAVNIVQKAINELGKLVTHVLKRMDASSVIPVYLIGGLFKEADFFVQGVAHSDELTRFLEMKNLNVILYDVSRENTATLVMQKAIKK